MENQVINNSKSEFGYNGKQNIWEWSARYGTVQYYKERIKLNEGWGSVDQMARERSWVSPYNFVQNNPILRIDPTGLIDNVYSVDSKGKVKLEKETADDFDMLYAKESFDKGQLNKGVKISDQSILPQLTKASPEANQKDWITGENHQGHYALTSSGNDAQNVFTFASDNSNVEWTLVKNKKNEYLVGTLHENSQALTTTGFKGFDRGSIKIDIHSHPNATRDDFRVSGTDQFDAEKTWKVNPNAKYYIYVPKLTKSAWNEVYPNQKINYEPKSKFIEIKY